MFLLTNIRKIPPNPKEKCFLPKQLSANIQCRKVYKKRFNEVTIHSIKAGTNDNIRKSRDVT